MLIIFRIIFIISIDFKRAVVLYRSINVVSFVMRVGIITKYNASIRKIVNIFIVIRPSSIITLSYKFCFVTYSQRTNIDTIRSTSISSTSGNRCKLCASNVQSSCCNRGIVSISFFCITCVFNVKRTASLDNKITGNLNGLNVINGVTISGVDYSVIADQINRKITIGINNIFYSTGGFVVVKCKCGTSVDDLILRRSICCRGADSKRFATNLNLSRINSTAACSISASGDACCRYKP